MIVPFANLFRKRGMLNHVAISLEAPDLEPEYLARFGLNEGQLCERKGKLLQQLLELQVKLDIPIMSVFLLSGRKLAPGFSMQLRHFKIVLGSLDMGFVEKHQVKVSPIGKWFELPSEEVEQMKLLIDSTKDYDKFFLNLCICYEGQGEILDACKMIARRVEKQKLDPESITKETIKDNLYCSNYLAPDLMIINDTPSLKGFLLWDASDSVIHFTKKPWPEFNPGSLKRIIESYRIGKEQ